MNPVKLRRQAATGRQQNSEMNPLLLLQPDFFQRENMKPAPAQNPTRTRDKILGTSN
jgi:hypothetical protein